MIWKIGMKDIVSADEPDQVVHVFEGAEGRIDQEVSLDVQARLAVLLDESGELLRRVHMSLVVCFEGALVDRLETNEHHDAAGIDQLPDGFPVLEEIDAEEDAVVAIALPDEVERLPEPFLADAEVFVAQHDPGFRGFAVRLEKDLLCDLDLFLQLVGLLGAVELAGVVRRDAEGAVERAPPGAVDLFPLRGFGDPCVIDGKDLFDLGEILRVADRPDAVFSRILEHGQPEVLGFPADDAVRMRPGLFCIEGNMQAAENDLFSFFAEFVGNFVSSGCVYGPGSDADNLDVVVFRSQADKHPDSHVEERFLV